MTDFFLVDRRHTSPTDLEERLANHGMISMAEQTQVLATGILSTEQGSPCMVAELSQMNADVLAESCASLFIDVCFVCKMDCFRTGE